MAKNNTTQAPAQKTFLSTPDESTKAFDARVSKWLFEQHKKGKHPMMERAYCDTENNHIVVYYYSAEFNDKGEVINEKD